MPPTVSALIPAWNAAATIERCVAAIRASSVPVTEILVADDGSTDGTGTLAEAAGARVVTLGGRKGICAGRNQLVREAKGELLWFVDSDSFAAPDCLARLLEGLEGDEKTGMAHGPNVLPPGLATISNTAYAILGRHHFLRTTTPRFTSHVTTANCLVPKQLVTRAGLFNHFRQGGRVFDFYEDLDLALRIRRLGFRCWFDPAAITLHENPRKSMASFLRHRVKCGICSTLMRYKHKDLASFGRLYADNPWFFLPLAPAVAAYSAIKALLIHLRYREVSSFRVLAAAPLVMLGQVFFAWGAIKGSFLHRRGRLLSETP